MTIWFTRKRIPPHDGIFWHECETPGCVKKVEFDDEPFCFMHTPNAGHIEGYSAFVKARNPEGEHKILQIPQRALANLTKRRSQ